MSIKKFFTQKTTIVLFLGFFVFSTAPLSVDAAVVTKPRNLSGRVLIEVEGFGRAWYVSPRDGRRYYIKVSREGVSTLATLAYGISNKDLAKLPESAGQRGDAKLVNRFRGAMLLAVENRGELWYVNPATNRRVLVNNANILDVLKAHGLPVKDKELATIRQNTKQIMFDPMFQGVASARLVGDHIVGGIQPTAIRPIASLTKLMTAMVVLDTSLDWSKPFVITPSIIRYPKDIIGDAGTSEVDLKVGDVVAIDDLWVSMLVASSNQSAAALADATGLPREEFVGRMNAKAASLGLTHTRFYEVAGLDSHNVSTAEEMAKLAAAAYAIPKIAQATQVLDRTFTVQTPDGSTRNVRVLDRNFSLRAFGVDAAKTGYLTEARSNAAIKKDNAIIVVLHANGVTDRNTSIKKLLN